MISRRDLGNEEPSNLTVDQCEELATAIAEEASSLPPGSKRENLLQLAKSYRFLAAIKRFIVQNVN
jgi:hypothetical protein